MVFSTSAPSFDGVNVVNIVCKDDIHGIQHLLELSKSGNSTLAITVIEKDVEFLGIVGNRLLLVDHNLTRASKAGVCYMEHNLAFSGSRHHTCQLKESDPVSDPPGTSPATVSSDDPVSDPPVTSTATVSSDVPWQVYAAVVITVVVVILVLVILVILVIFIYKLRGDIKPQQLEFNKHQMQDLQNRMVDEFRKAFITAHEKLVILQREQLEFIKHQMQDLHEKLVIPQREKEDLEQHIKSLKDQMQKLQRKKEMMTRPMADDPQETPTSPSVSLGGVKRRPKRTLPPPSTWRHSYKPEDDDDDESFQNTKEEGKVKEADNPCSGVTASGISSPTPVLFMRDGCTPPQATSSTDTPREPPRGAARNGSARDLQHTTPHGDNRTDNTASDQPVYRNTGYGHGTGGSGGHGGGSGGGGYGGGRSGDCGVGVGNGSGGGQEGPEEQQPLLEQRTQPQD